MHGKVSEIFFNESMIFKDIPQGFKACRYHSLIVENLPETLIEIAKTRDNINMAIKHRDFDIYGVQFHPEAILTEYGKQLLINFTEN